MTIRSTIEPRPRLDGCPTERVDFAISFPRFVVYSGRVRFACRLDVFTPRQRSDVVVGTGGDFSMVLPTDF